MRFLFYSHDSYGLGHLRRSLTVASRLLKECPGASVLIATGSPVATRFRLPRGVDILKLPSVTKDADGRYVSRSWGLDITALIHLRSQLISATVRSFRPDVLLVDHKPIGLLGELLPVLSEARVLGTQCVLGLRDIVDHPDAMAREWSDPDVREALEHHYDRILVYGDANVFDASVEYRELRPCASRLEFTGYIARPPARPPCRALPLPEPRVVVTVGGGEDGVGRVSAFLDVIEGRSVDWKSTIILGPLFGDEAGKRVRHRVAALAGVVVHRFHDDLPALFRDASAVVSMAGYNTCTEILEARAPSVLLPREFPRLEQRVRADRLAGLGLARSCPDLDPDRLGDLITEAIHSRRIRRELPALNGAESAATKLGECARTAARRGNSLNHRPKFVARLLP